MTATSFESVLITGASSGIGEAVAVACAQGGTAHLFLAGRDRARLDTVSDACRAAGCPDVHTEVIDVADAARMAAWVASCDAAAPLTVVFANAGRGTGAEVSASVRRTFDVNVIGVVNTILPALDCLRARKGKGHLVITSSMTAYAPLAQCPSYAATKACVKTWGLSLRGHLRREGIRVSVICPGFVRSRITDRNTCPMPFFMEAPKAARIILRRVARNVGLITFPWPLRFATWLLGLLPWRLRDLFVVFLLLGGMCIQPFHH